GEGEPATLPTLGQRIPALPLPAGGSTRPACAPGADRTGGPGPATTAPPPSPSTSGAPPAPGRRSWHRDSRPARPGWNAGAPEPARAPADGVRRRARQPVLPPSAAPEGYPPARPPPPW